MPTCKIHGTELVCLSCMGAAGGRKTASTRDKDFYREVGLQGGKPSKLTKRQWRDIAASTQTRTELAKKYGVSTSLIAYIQRRNGHQSAK